MKMNEHFVPPQTANKKYQVKLSQLKLQLGLFGANVAAANDKVAIEIVGKGSSKTAKYLGLAFHRRSKRQSTHTTLPRNLSTKARYLVWDARDLSDFHVVLANGSLSASEIAFHVLYGEGSADKSKVKPAVVGKATMNITVAELLVREEMQTTSSKSRLNRKLAIELKVNGLSIEATLSVSVSFAEIRNTRDSHGKVENSVEPGKNKLGVIQSVKHLTSLRKKDKGKSDHKVQQEQFASLYESDRSPIFDSDDSSNECTTNTSGLSSIHNAESKNSNFSERFTTRSETEPRLDRVQRSWSISTWNRSFRGIGLTTNKEKPLTLTNGSGLLTESNEVSSQLGLDNDNCGASNCELKELTSRDGQAKLKTNVFFASFDQRSEKASGESACTALVALIAHWLHSNQDMPTRPEFDGLITEGSSEWRKLCKSHTYSKRFPDKHFDLETVIEAKLRPLAVLPEKSYTGFFSPEKFECLKGHMSFDGIWDGIKSSEIDYEPRVYIVSWNDHFFVLKVESDAYYVIDTLGERLFEGCRQAYILRFDESSLMYEKVNLEKEATPKENRDTSKSGTKSEEERLEVVCRGKECCKEFIKRFLAAIQIRQLEEEEKKGNAVNTYLHRRLQIEFHYSSSLSSSSSSSPSSFTLSSSSSSSPSSFTL